MKTNFNKKSVMASIMMMGILSSVPVYAMDTKEDEARYQIQQMLNAQFPEGYDDMLANQQGPSWAIPTFGDVVHTATKYVSRETVGSIADASGLKFLKNVHDVYSLEAGVVPNSALTTQMGDFGKTVVSSIPGGENIVAAAQFLKAPGHETLGSTIASIVFKGAEKIDTNADTSKIVGDMAKVGVENMIPGGKYITTATGWMGRSLFGTSTLTEGLFQTASSLYDLYNNPPSLAPEDESSED